MIYLTVIEGDKISNTKKYYNIIKTLLQLMIMISLVSLKAGAIINLHNYYDLVWHYKTKIKSIKINFTF